MNSSVVIVELGCGGHHTLYTKMILDQGFDGYLLVSAETWDSLPTKTRENSRATVQVVFDTAWNLPKQVEILFAFLSAHPTVTVCFLISYVEVVVPLICRQFTTYRWLAGKVAISGFWMADNLAESRHKSWGRIIKWWALLTVLTAVMSISWRMRLVFLNDQTLRSLCVFPWLRSRMYLCPDPVDLSDLSPDVSIDSPAHAVPTIIFAGIHSERKGTCWAIEALQHWKTPLKIVIAGRVYDKASLEQAIAKLPPFVTTIVNDHHLDSNQWASHFIESDFVIMPYRKFGGSSSIFVHALFYGKPVLVTDHGLMGRQVHSMKCGGVFRPDDPVDFVRQLDLLLENPPQIRDNPEVVKFLNERTPHSFYQVLLTAISAR